MDIKVGEYVRTNEGIIDKVKDFSNYTSFYHCENGMIIDVYSKCATYLKDIVKHSFNIIDLIEVGDYVNGKYVEKINQYESGKSIIALIGIIDEEDIKSIVTKEQFESMEYKVGD